jgi:sec-independent protein translocase protein TatB
VLALGCWLGAAPAAAELLPDVHAQAATAPAAQVVEDTVSTAGATAEQVAAPVIAEVSKPVQQTADRVTQAAGAATPPAAPAPVDTVVRDVSAPAAQVVKSVERAVEPAAAPVPTPPQSGPAAGSGVRDGWTARAARVDGPRGGDRLRPAGQGGPRPARVEHFGASVDRTASPVDPFVWSIASPAEFDVARPAFGAAPSGPAEDEPATPDQQPGPFAGSPASGLSGSFSFGGLAVLAAALCLAAPALRRRLLIRPAMRWPGAFVPLLERPG